MYGSKLDPFNVVHNHDARPRRCKDADAVEEVPGTCLRYVVTMPINPSRQAADLSTADWEHAERMEAGRFIRGKW